jgi:hypothetical protein
MRREGIRVLIVLIFFSRREYFMPFLFFEMITTMGLDYEDGRLFGWCS